MMSKEDRAKVRDLKRLAKKPRNDKPIPGGLEISLLKKKLAESGFVNTGASDWEHPYGATVSFGYKMHEWTVVFKRGRGGLPIFYRYLPNSNQGGFDILLYQKIREANQ